MEKLVDTTRLSKLVGAYMRSDPNTVHAAQAMELARCEIQREIDRTMAGFIIFASGLHAVVFDDADSLGAGATGAELGEHESKIYGINPSLIFLAPRRCNAPNKPSTINENPSLVPCIRFDNYPYEEEVEGAEEYEGKGTEDKDDRDKFPQTIALLYRFSALPLTSSNLFEIMKPTDPESL